MTRRRVLIAAQLAAALVVVAAVAVYFRKLLADPALSDAPEPRWAYLGGAALCYLAAHGVFGTFFYQLLRRHDDSLRYTTAVRAYAISQVGKYVPGKAWVILLRVWLLRDTPMTRSTVAVCGTLETLTSMGAGAALGLACLPWAGFAVPAGFVVALAILFVAPLGMVLLGGRAASLAKRLTASKLAWPELPIALLVRGFAQGLIGWCLVALSLHLALVALLPDPATASQLDPRGELAASCLGYVAGFAALIVPGGVGARELVYQQLVGAQLAGLVGGAEAHAALVAVALRLVWTAAELAVIGPWALLTLKPRARVGAPELAGSAP